MPTFVSHTYVVVQYFVHQPLGYHPICIPSHMSHVVGSSSRWRTSPCWTWVTALASLTMPPAMRVQPRRRCHYTKLSPEEMRLANLRYDGDGMRPSKVAWLLRRDKSTMTRLLVKQKAWMNQGRPCALHNATGDNLVPLLELMVAQVDGKYEVTVDKLRRRTGAEPTTNLCRTDDGPTMNRRRTFSEPTTNRTDDNRRRTDDEPTTNRCRIDGGPTANRRRTDDARSDGEPTTKRRRRRRADDEPTTKRRTDAEPKPNRRRTNELTTTDGEPTTHEPTASRRRTSRRRNDEPTTNRRRRRTYTRRCRRCSYYWV